MIIPSHILFNINQEIVWSVNLSFKIFAHFYFHVTGKCKLSLYTIQEEILAEENITGYDTSKTISS